MLACFVFNLGNFFCNAWDELLPTWGMSDLIVTSSAGLSWGLSAMLSRPVFLPVFYLRGWG